MGRKAMPIDLLLVQGNKNKLTKKEIEARKKSEEKIKPNADKIKAPAFLCRSAKLEFNKLAAELQQTEVLTNVDVDLLGWYCWANDHLKTKLNELSINEIDKLMNRIKSIAVEYGLTPASRAKLAMPKEEEKEKSTEEKLFGDV
jgi:phage terminase small subunit